MYEVIQIIGESIARLVRLRNCENNIVHECFDDSAVVSDENFGFMRVGQLYNCKIKLFGKVVTEKTATSFTCTVSDARAVIGKKTMVEVQTKTGVYYVPLRKASGYQRGDMFEFACTRKDLIQVDNTVHADLLE